MGPRNPSQRSLDRPAPLISAMRSPTGNGMGGGGYDQGVVKKESQGSFYLE